MPSDIVWVQCQIRAYGASHTKFPASITLLGSFWPVTRLIKADDIFHTVVAGPFWQLYHAYGSVQAIIGLWPEGIL